MTAWEFLKTASALATGTAWGLITHPKTGSGVVLNDGYRVEVAGGYTAEVADLVLLAKLATAQITVELTDGYTVELRETRTPAELNLTGTVLETP